MKDEARLNRPVEGAKDGSIVRDHYEVAARKGNAGAIKRLAGPEYPSELEYLREWLRDLHGRSGVGMGGLMPLSYTTIADWSRLKDVHPEPHEVDALIYLDTAMLHPGEPEADE